jgi:hypothetical protein
MGWVLVRTLCDLCDTLCMCGHAYGMLKSHLMGGFSLQPQSS